MKIYILKEFIYTNDGAYSNILGAFKNKKDAESLQELTITGNIKNYGFVKENGTHETKVIFLGFQENWDNYIEYEIIETELK